MMFHNRKIKRNFLHFREKLYYANIAVTTKVQIINNLSYLRKMYEI
jgi:hypothetical protein